MSKTCFLESSLYTRVITHLVAGQLRTFLCGFPKELSVWYDMSVFLIENNYLVDVCSTIRGPVIMYSLLREAGKNLTLVALPLKSYPPPFHELSGHIFWDFFFELKSSFFLVALPLPPPPRPLSGQATKKNTFFAAFLNSGGQGEGFAVRFFDLPALPLSPLSVSISIFSEKFISLLHFLLNLYEICYDLKKEISMFLRK